MGEFSLQDVLDGLDVDVPIVDVKFKGDRVVLYLYGGRVIERVIAGGKLRDVKGKERELLVEDIKDESRVELAKGPALLAQLERMTLDELRRKASAMGIKPYQRRKVDLVQALYSRCLGDCNK